MTNSPARTLPPRWVHASLDQLVPPDGVFSDGDWVETKDQDPSGDVRLIQLADVGERAFLDQSARFLTSSRAEALKCTYLQKGDLLVARMPEPLGRACIFPLSGEQRFVTAVDVCIVRLGSRSIDRKFLMHAINSPHLRAAIDEHKSGSTRKRISRKNLARISIPVAPLTEQHRIVARIEELFSELDNGIQNLQTAREHLKIYRHALLTAAFDGRLTADWRRQHNDAGAVRETLATIGAARVAQYGERLQEWQSAAGRWEQTGKRGPKPQKPVSYRPPRPLTDDELESLPTIPASWQFVRLCQLATIGSGMSVSKARKLVDAVEVPYLRVANVQRGYLSLDDMKLMSVERSQLTGLLLKKWDVLFNEGGDRDKLGRGWIWESQIEPCITQNHVFRASPFLRDGMAARWISHWGSAFGQMYFDSEGKQTTNLASINKPVLSNFPVPVAPLSEQQEILTRLESQFAVINHLEAEITDSLQRLERLRQSILAKAFSGKLVPQYPADEPASVLLDRIKAEREQAAEAGTNVSKNTPSKKRNTAA